MEKKKILKKLSLNKDVISSLDSSDMNYLRGGGDTILSICNSCIDSNCDYMNTCTAPPTMQGPTCNSCVSQCQPCQESNVLTCDSCCNPGTCSVQTSYDAGTTCCP